MLGYELVLACTIATTTADTTCPSEGCLSRIFDLVTGKGNDVEPGE